MNNYKLLENRPELSHEQVMKGMNFAAVQSGALMPAKVLIKAGAAKMLAAKIALGVVVLTSSAIIYTRLTSGTEPGMQNTVLVSEVEHKETKDTLILKNTVNSVETVNSVTRTPLPENKVQENKQLVSEIKLTSPDTLKSLTPEIKSEEVIKPVEVQQTATVIKRVKPFKASPNVKCVLLTSHSFCDPPVKREHVNINMKCDECEFNFISCEELDKVKDIVGVWLTIDVSKKTSFKVASNFKNIQLVRSSGETVNPSAIGIGTFSRDVKEPKFYSSSFKAKKFIATFKNQVDIFLFIENAKVGDKVFIDDFIQAEIVE